MNSILLCRYKTVKEEIIPEVGQEEIEWAPEMEANTADLKISLIAEHDQEPILGATVTVKCVSPLLNKSSNVADSTTPTYPGTYILEDVIPMLGDHGCKVTATKDGCGGFSDSFENSYELESIMICPL